eukprot:1623541-Rhodomonas_salina.2
MQDKLELRCPALVRSHEARHMCRSVPARIVLVTRNPACTRWDAPTRDLRCVQALGGASENVAASIVPHKTVIADYLNVLAVLNRRGRCDSGNYFASVETAIPRARQGTVVPLVDWTSYGFAPDVPIGKGAI